MLRGYRLLGAAALGISVIISLGTGAYFGALQATYNSSHSEKSAYSSGKLEQGNPSQIDRDRAGLPDFAEHIASAPDPKDADEREKRDLAAQEASALWGFWILIVSGLGAIVTMIGTGFLLWQIILTRQAVEDTGKATDAMVEANRISELVNRPFVVSFPKIEHCTVEGDLFCITLNVDFKNIGLTVASGFRPSIKIFFVDNISNEPNAFFKGLRGEDVHDENFLMPQEIRSVALKNNYSIDQMPWQNVDGRVRINFLICCSVIYNVSGKSHRKDRLFTQTTYSVGLDIYDVVRRRWFYNDDIASANADQCVLTPSLVCRRR